MPWLSKIFETNLADLSINTYKLLTKEVGQTFEVQYTEPTKTGNINGTVCIREVLGLGATD